MSICSLARLFDHRCWRAIRRRWYNAGEFGVVPNRTGRDNPWKGCPKETGGCANGLTGKDIHIAIPNHECVGWSDSIGGEHVGHRVGCWFPWEPIVSSDDRRKIGF